MLVSIYYILYFNTLKSYFSFYRSMHPNGEECSHCPTCVLLSVMPILSKIASHPTLLQCPRGGDIKLNFAHNALQAKSLGPMGGSVHSSRIEDIVNNVQHSGKMKSIEILLTSFSKNREKTLLFSYSTQTLSMIESYVKARGWRYCRLDGTTLAKTRQAMVDKFNRDGNILVFLISTKAGGVGLNLTSASKVILFDCNWNPAQDAQAQDRAYRMGQLEHVTVYRLIAQGTIEEVAYMRQLYKKVMQNTAISVGDDDIARGRFEGIQGDSDARGELFGCENMLQFENGSILLRLRGEYDVRYEDNDCRSEKVRCGDDTADENDTITKKRNTGDITGSGDAMLHLPTSCPSAGTSSIGIKTKQKTDLNKLVTLNEKSAQELVALFANKESANKSGIIEIENSNVNLKTLEN